MSLARLTKQISERHDLPEIVIKDILVDSITIILKTAMDEGRMQIRGFGVFSRKEVATKIARNIQTGERVVVPPHSKVVFVEERTRKKKGAIGGSERTLELGPTSVPEGRN